MPGLGLGQGLGPGIGFGQGQGQEEGFGAGPGQGPGLAPGIALGPGDGQGIGLGQGLGQGLGVSQGIGLGSSGKVRPDNEDPPSVREQGSGLAQGPGLGPGPGPGLGQGQGIGSTSTHLPNPTASSPRRNGGGSGVGSGVSGSGGGGSRAPPARSCHVRPPPFDPTKETYTVGNHKHNNNNNNNNNNTFPYPFFLSLLTFLSFGDINHNFFDFVFTLSLFWSSFFSSPPPPIVRSICRICQDSLYLRRRLCLNVRCYCLSSAHERHPSGPRSTSMLHSSIRNLWEPQSCSRRMFTVSY